MDFGGGVVPPWITYRLVQFPNKKYVRLAKSISDFAVIFIKTLMKMTALFLFQVFYRVSSYKRPC